MSRDFRLDVQHPGGSGAGSCLWRQVDHLPESGGEGAAGYGESAFWLGRGNQAHIELVSYGLREGMVLKKICQIALLCLLAITLTGCLGPSPESTVNDFFSAVKAGDFDTVANCIGQENQDEFRDELETGEELDDEKRVEFLFSKLSWEILSTSTEENQAEVKAKVTSIDIVRVSTDVISKIMPLAFAAAFDDNSDDKIEELTEQYFESALSDPDAPTVTNEVTIKLVKEEGDWVIVPDDDLLNALTGNAGKLAEMFDDEEQE
jgi:hypothetical protein